MWSDPNPADGPCNTSLPPQDVTNIAWAYARLNVQHRPVFEALADRILKDGMLRTFTQQACDVCTWAFEHIGYREERLSRALWQQAMTLR